ncbi:uncharacterized protein LACBIDRAFT_330798 [Laccaria bicolor S238N-H82]|uniref:Predicted protein n=1 Tax=Laccaria bicolor (strain S238N-H82 / ATCC MYA-4686) TaxID=486041 RepID=B0DMI0_LACBS|nr:uncharacterized protein LACBIDRAFT_330798 [Laccaria bicolor S238N-H82]EDR04190.1 predicted protein [Laccaria bicolor S238N-H82]|eukprot:XP_001885081.1 predicted protein [Laccaria bicolor S238N-H82]
MYEAANTGEHTPPFILSPANSLQTAQGGPIGKSLSILRYSSTRTFLGGSHRSLLPRLCDSISGDHVLSASAFGNHRGGPWLLGNFQASAMDLTPLPSSLSTSHGPYGLEIMGSGDRKMRRTIPYFCCAPTNVWGRFRYAWRMWRPAAIRILKSIGRRSVDSEDGAAEHLNLLLDSALDFGCRPHHGPDLSFVHQRVSYCTGTAKIKKQQLIVEWSRKKWEFDFDEISALKKPTTNKQHDGRV